MICMGKYNIIFIGGVPGVGKTSISGYLARKFGIDIMLSGDYLREFARLSGQEDSGILKYSVYDAWKAYGNFSDDNIIKGYEAQASLLGRGLSLVMDRANKNGENLIMESLYINEEVADSIARNGAKACYIIIPDRGTHEQRLLQRSEFTHFNSPGSRLAEHLYEYRLIMEHSKKLCEKKGIKVFENADFNATRSAISSYMSEKIKDQTLKIKQ